MAACRRRNLDDGVAGEDLLDEAVHLAGALPRAANLGAGSAGRSAPSPQGQRHRASEISVSNGLMVSIMTTHPSIGGRHR